MKACHGEMKTAYQLSAAMKVSAGVMAGGSWR
jgi:hypothetical protein